MFRRRNHRTLLQKVREIFWPSMGWVRTYHYFRHRIARLHGTADSIACGLASGAAVSFTPFLGLHILIGCMITWMLRGNMIAAALGTAAGNPWTFPVIWLFTYKVGSLMMLGLLPDSVNHIPPDFSLKMMWEQPLQLFMPMALGGIVCAVIVWFGVFYVMRVVIQRYQRRRARRRRRKMLRQKLAARKARREAENDA